MGYLHFEETSILLRRKFNIGWLLSTIYHITYKKPETNLHSQRMEPEFSAELFRFGRPVEHLSAVGKGGVKAQSRIAFEQVWELGSVEFAEPNGNQKSKNSLIATSHAA